MKISDKNGFIKHTAIGVAISSLVTAAALFIIAAAVYFADAPESLYSPLASIALAIGCFFGGLYCSLKVGGRGLICGLSVAAALFLILLAASAAVDFDKIGVLTLIHAVSALLSGAIGGILGVNTKSGAKI